MGVKSELFKSGHWLAGIQWLFFIFTNTVVIPITIGAAFDLPNEKIVIMLNLSFILTGIACIIQALLGHRRAIMEGQSGLWWGVILTIIATSSAKGIPFEVVGGSLVVGIVISGVISIFIGMLNLGSFISKLFNSTVMGVFMFLFGVQLISIFLKGMFGIPFSNSEFGNIDLVITAFSIAVAILVIYISIKGPAEVRQYSLLIGIVAGWIAYAIIFKGDNTVSQSSAEFNIELFPLGKPTLNTGIIITAILTGLLNTANTFGSLKGTDEMYGRKSTRKQYRASFTISGIFTIIAGVFGLVPYSPYVSSIGFLNQTRIITRLPFILGGFMFLVMGLIPPVGAFFSLIPLSVGSAVLFVAYLQLLKSSWLFFDEVEFNSDNIYRPAIPIFVGIIIMTMPSANFDTIPSIIRPLISSGLLVGIILAIIMENVFKWERYGVRKKQSEAE